MTEEQKPQEESIELNAEMVANAVLASDMGWAVLDQMYAETTRMILLTQSFVGVVNQHRELLKERLTDYIGFEKRFNTMMNDIGSIGQRVNGVVINHKNRTGKPTDEEHMEILAYSQAYTILQNEFDSTVVPLIDALSEDIKNAVPEISKQQ